MLIAQDARRRWCMSPPVCLQSYLSLSEPYGHDTEAYLADKHADEAMRLATWHPPRATKVRRVCTQTVCRHTGLVRHRWFVGLLNPGLSTCVCAALLNVFFSALLAGEAGADRGRVPDVSNSGN